MAKQFALEEKVVTIRSDKWVGILHTMQGVELCYVNMLLYYININMLMTPTSSPVYSCL